MQTLPFLGAIGWAHIRLVGGWKSIFGVTALYVALIFGIVFLSVRADPDHLATILRGWTYVILFLQGSMLLIFGSLRTNSAIRHDMTTNMLESHRMMPIHPTQAIASYLLGATLPVAVLTCANLLMAVVIGGIGGLNIFEIAATHALLIPFALFIWTMVALLSFQMRFVLGLVGMLFFTSIVSGGTLLLFLPVTRVLIYSLVQGTLFSFMHPSLTGDLNIGHAISVLAQLTLALVFFFTTARKYARGDQPAFDIRLGLILMLVWTALSLIGMIFAESFWPSSTSYYSQQDFSGLIGLIASLLATLLIALVPLAAAARALARSRRSIAPFAALAASILLTLSLPLAGFFQSARFDLRESSLPGAFPLHVLQTAAVIAAFCTAIFFTFALLYRLRAKFIPALIVVTLLFTWAGPLVLDLARHLIFDFQNNNVMSSLSGVSPVGAIIEIWELFDTGAPNPLPGAVVQLLAAAGMAALYFAVARKRAAADALREVLSEKCPAVVPPPILAEAITPPL